MPDADFSADIAMAFEQLASIQQPLDEDIARITAANLWDLY